MAHTRTLTGIIHKPTGDPWAGFKVDFALTPTAHMSHATLPATVATVTTGEDGTFSVALEVGVQYEARLAGAFISQGFSTTYPPGTRFKFVLPDGAGSISLEEVVALNAPPDGSGSFASALSSHIASHTNPHQVTAAQLADFDAEVTASPSVAAHTATLSAHTSELADHEARVTGVEKKQTSGTRGLSAPNPGASRLLPLPAPLASPPTFTLGTSGGATAISGSVAITPASDVFHRYGSPIWRDDVNFRWSSGAAVTLGTMLTQAEWSLEFGWYGRYLEVDLNGSSTAAWRMWVDEKGYDVLVGRSGMASDGATWKHYYDFGSAAVRRIRIDFNKSCTLRGIRIGPTDSIWKPETVRGPKVVVTGDSFAEQFSSWPTIMGWLLGWKDIYQCGVGGTGYLTVNPSNNAFRNRAQKDIYDQSPDVVIVSGGLNDNTQDAAAVQVEAATFYQEIKAHLPNSVLIVSGFNTTNGAPGGASWVLTRDAIRAAAQQYADLYIDQMGGPYPYSGTISNYTNVGWMTGSGRAGSPSGSGNSDIFRSTDSTHPTAEGHVYRGYRHAAAIAAAMPILGAS